MDRKAPELMQEFDKDRFVNHCCGACNASRQTLLDIIEEYQNKDWEVTKYLEAHRDELWKEQDKGDQFRQLCRDVGEEKIIEDAIVALRAMADKLESGKCVLITAEVPQVPIFDGENSSHISVSIAKHCMGG